MEVRAYPGDLLAQQRFAMRGIPFIEVAADPLRVVVLGRGTPLRPDIRVENCLCDKVPVYRRKGGGGAVVLDKGMLVITGCFPSISGIFAPQWSSWVSSLVLRALRNAGAGRDVVIRGLGDLCLVSKPGRERKILGSSLYVGRQLVLYQASLLYCADLGTIDRYLALPSRMPSYRRNRSHIKFLANCPPEWHLTSTRLQAELNRQLFLDEPLLRKMRV